MGFFNEFSVELETKINCFPKHFTLFQSSRRGRRSTKSRKSINIVLTENVRRSSRISTKFNASVEELKTNATVKTATRVSKRYFI